MDWIDIEKKWDEMARRLQHGLPPRVEWDTLPASNDRTVVPPDPAGLQDDSVAA